MLREERTRTPTSGWGSAGGRARGRRRRRAPRPERAAGARRTRACRARAGAPARALIAHDQLRAARLRVPGAWRSIEASSSARAELRYQRSSASAARAGSGARSSSAPAFQPVLARGAGTRRSGTASPPCHATPGRARARAPRAAGAPVRAPATARASRARRSISASPVRCRDDQLRAGPGHEHEPQPACARRPPQPHADRPAAQQHRALALHSRQTMRRAGRADHRAPGLPRRGPVLARGLRRGRLGRHARRPHPRDLARAAARRA